MTESLAKTESTTPTQLAIAEIWRDLLGRDDIGPDDDFFAAGGTSMTAIKFLQRVVTRFGPDVLSPDTLYADPRLSSLSRAIDDAVERA